MIYKTSLFEFSSIEELEKSIFDKYNSDEEFRKEREKIYYKSFKIEELFERCRDGDINIPLKNLNKEDFPSKSHTLPLVTMTKFNNGIGGYVSINSLKIKPANNILTFVQGTDGCSGICFYQKNDFVSNGICSLRKKCKDNFDEKSYILLSKYITKIFHNKFHNFSRSCAVGNDFNRELIFLPVYQDDQGEEHISVKTLSYLYDRIKFNEYKKRIAELEREKSSIKSSLEIYEGNIKTEKGDKKVFYKAFRVGDLFERSSSHKLSVTIKNLATSDVKTEEFPIANITASSNNNGAACFLKETEEVKQKKKEGKLTIAINCNYNGICFYQDREFVSTGDNSYLEIKNDSFKNSLDKCKDAYYFLSKALTSIYMNKFHGWTRKLGNGNDFDREIILLPCYEDNSISTSKMAELYQSSVIKSKEDGISERERAIKQIKTEMLNFIKTI